MFPIIIIFITLVSAATSTPRCQKVGKFPLKDPQTYLECRLLGSSDQLVPTFWSCGDLYYSPSGRTCVPQNELKHEIQRSRRSSEFIQESFVETVTQMECGENNMTGIYCVNRTHVAVCYTSYSEVGEQSNKTLAYPCNGDTVCLPGKGCTKDDSLLSRSRPFACSGVGRFPDPYNCSVYHDCINSTAEPTGFSQTTLQCNNDQIYSTKLKNCTSTTEVQTCSSGIRIYCHSDLEVGVLTDDSTIFYVCHTAAGYPGDLAPSLYSCPAQHNFNPAVLACVSNQLNINWNELPSPTIFS